MMEFRKMTFQFSESDMSGNFVVTIHKQKINYRFIMKDQSVYEDLNSEDGEKQRFALERVYNAFRNLKSYGDRTNYFGLTPFH